MQAVSIEAVINFKIMAKPILVVYYLPEAVLPNGNISNVRMNEAIEERFTDYHTIALPSRLSIEEPIEDIRFKVLNVDKMNVIDFEEFKKIIIETVTNINA